MYPVSTSLNLALMPVCATTYITCRHLQESVHTLTPYTPSTQAGWVQPPMWYISTFSRGSVIDARSSE